MFEKLKEKRRLRVDAVNKAREGFTSWLEISKSVGWKLYEEKVNKKIENIRNKIEGDTSLTPEELKRLQLALQVWKQVLLIPTEIKENAMGGIRNANEER